ncbi:MAG: DUF1343 domain-containing protein [Gemmatimonadaceae bacterium]
MRLKEGLAIGVIVLGCATSGGGGPATEGNARSTGRSPRGVKPGISVLLDDSIALVRGKRVGLLTNQSGLDERGRSDIDLLASDPRARAAGVRLVALFSPEHGIRGTEDHPHIAGGVDETTGLRIYSLYTRTTIAPPDSVLRQTDVLVYDLQDVGTRTWTYVGALVYAMRASARLGLPVVVLDRPNPLGGADVDGPMLDSALANPDDDIPSRPGRAYALWPVPLRHGMTVGEMARLFNDELHLGCDLHVVPAEGWHRDSWFDETGLPFVKPSPNLPSLTSELVYPALVPFEGSNLSVGRGTPEAFQQVGAPWLRARDIAAALNERGLAGVRFEARDFTPDHPTDGKYPGVRLPGVRVVVVDRRRVHPGRVGAALLWAIGRVHGDSLRLRDAVFDDRFGRARLRVALLRGDDPDTVMDGELPSVVAFRERARRYFIYR